MGNNVVYPDFTMEKTREWWKDALDRFILYDQVVKFDGLFLVNEKLEFDSNTFYNSDSN